MRPASSDPSAAELEYGGLQRIEGRSQNHVPARFITAQVAAARTPEPQYEAPPDWVEYLRKNNSNPQGMLTETVRYVGEHPTRQTLIEAAAVIQALARVPGMSSYIRSTITRETIEQAIGQKGSER
jgi:hypothetical protein